MTIDLQPSIIAGPRISNALLLSLGGADLALLGPMEPVVLPLRSPLEDAGCRIEYAHFIDDGVASVVASNGAGTAVEIGVIGREGMTGTSLIYGDDQATFSAYMQVAGSAHRVEAAVFNDAMQRSPTLTRRLLHYAHVLSIQTAATAFVNGQEMLPARLARWLLMISDRVGSPFNITHEFIAIMLAVRRSGVTLAIQDLEGKGLIRALRGSIAILDRPGTIAAASSIYGVPEQEYRRLLG